MLGYILASRGSPPAMPQKRRHDTGETITGNFKQRMARSDVPLMDPQPDMDYGFGMEPQLNLAPVFV